MRIPRQYTPDMQPSVPTYPVLTAAVAKATRGRSVVSVGAPSGMTPFMPGGRGTAPVPGSGGFGGLGGSVFVPGGGVFVPGNAGGGATPFVPGGPGTSPITGSSGFGGLGSNVFVPGGGVFVPGNAGGGATPFAPGGPGTSPITGSGGFGGLGSNVFAPGGGVFVPGDVRAIPGGSGLGQSQGPGLGSLTTAGGRLSPGSGMLAGGHAPGDITDDDGSGDKPDDGGLPPGGTDGVVEVEVHGTRNPEPMPKEPMDPTQPGPQTGSSASPPSGSASGLWGTAAQPYLMHLGGSPKGAVRGFDYGLYYGTAAAVIALGGAATGLGGVVIVGGFALGGALIGRYFSGPGGFFGPVPHGNDPSPDDAGGGRGPGGPREGGDFPGPDDAGASGPRGPRSNTDAPVGYRQNYGELPGPDDTGGGGLGGPRSNTAAVGYQQHYGDFPGPDAAGAGGPGGPRSAGTETVARGQNYDDFPTPDEVGGGTPRSDIAAVAS
jgi:hypothetical protein